MSKEVCHNWWLEYPKMPYESYDMNNMIWKYNFEFQILEIKWSLLFQILFVLKFRPDGIIIYSL